MQICHQHRRKFLLLKFPNTSCVINNPLEYETICFVFMSLLIIFYVEQLNFSVFLCSVNHICITIYSLPPTHCCFTNCSVSESNTTIFKTGTKISLYSIRTIEQIIAAFPGHFFHFCSVCIHLCRHFVFDAFLK